MFDVTETQNVTKSTWLKGGDGLQNKRQDTVNVVEAQLVIINNNNIHTVYIVPYKVSVLCFTSHY